jgi:hypothetical protein
VCTAGVPVVATVNAITTGGYVIRQHIAEPAYAPYAALLGGTTFRAGDLYGVLGIAFSLPNTADIGTSDYLRKMEVGVGNLPSILMSLPAQSISTHLASQSRSIISRPSVRKPKRRTLVESSLLSLSVTITIIIRIVIVVAVTGNVVDPTWNHLVCPAFTKGVVMCLADWRHSSSQAAELERDASVIHGHRIPDDCRASGSCGEPCDRR